MTFSDYAEDRITKNDYNKHLVVGQNVELIGWGSRFQTPMASTKISDISHNEDAWQKYVDSGQMINFDMAFQLKAI